MDIFSFFDNPWFVFGILPLLIFCSRVVDLIRFLQDDRYGVTFLPAQGLHGSVKILFPIIPRTEAEKVVSFIKKVNPQAFYTIEDVRFVNDLNDTYLSIEKHKRPPILRS